MQRLLRTILVVALAAALGPSALAQPVKVQLPRPLGGAPRPLNRDRDKDKESRDSKDSKDNKDSKESDKAAPTAVQLTQDDLKSGPDRKRMAATGLYQLDFDKVDIDKLVQTISDMTGRLFILPENIRGKITIIGPEHGKVGVTADEAYQAFLAALDANGLTLYQSGRYQKILEKRQGKQSPIPTLLEEGAPFTTNEQMVTKLFKLHFVEAEPVRAVIQQLVSRDGDTIAFPPDVLIVNDLGLNLHRLEKIIERLDTLSSTDEIRVIQVLYASASDMAEKLRQVFEEKNKKPGQRSGQAVITPAGSAPAAGAAAPAPAAPAAAGQVEEAPATLSQLIADERTNKLIIIANEKAFVRIQELLRQLDTPIPGEGQVHVYYLSNANAEELASTLASLTQGIAAKGPRPATPAGGAAKASTVADLFSGEVKITADKSTNSLVIIANNSDYRNLINVIEKLDIARRQVFVEAVIMEVNLKNEVDWGMALHGGNSIPGVSVQGQPSFGVAGSEVGSSNSLAGVLSLASLGGFLAGLQGPLLSDLNSKLPAIPAFSIVMHALQANSDVNVISTPHILASDNEDAEITVGQNVPFQAGITSPLASSLTSGSSSTAGTAALLTGYSGLIAPIQRQNVELKLKIKPQINESDFIRMQIEEQTEEIASQDARLGPTTAKRSIKSNIVARDQQTVVLGGLIQDRVVKSVNKVPLLGDIPILGWLFRDNTSTKQRTNLLLFLTPYIIRDQSDFRRIFERKMKERQEFVEQFYGRQPGYHVAIDYARKAGPLALMLKSLDNESAKFENGGPGTGNERLYTPKWGQPGDPTHTRVKINPSYDSLRVPSPAPPAPAPAPAPGTPLPSPSPELKATPPGEPAGGPPIKEPEAPVEIH